jgi:hypothetical protein
MARDVAFGDILLVPSGLPDGRVLLFMPLYSTGGGMTKLNRVVVADVFSRNLAAIGNDKHSAVAALLRLQPNDAGTVGVLAAQALKLHNQIQQAARQGQWARYGKLMSQQREILQRLHDAAKE